MIGDPGIRNLFHLITEFRVRCNAVTVNEVDGEEEGGSRGGRRTVAFPRVTDEQEIQDKLFSPALASRENLFLSRKAAVSLLQSSQLISPQCTI